MKKVTRTLIFVIIVLIVVLFTFLNYADKKSDVSKKIGNKIYGGTISTIDFAKVVKVYNLYNEMLKNGEYQSAYDALSYEYRQIKDYDTFLNDIKNKSIVATDNISEVRQLTDYTYMVTSIVNENEVQSLIIYNPSTARYQIAPEAFIEHQNSNRKIKKDKAIYEVFETNNYVDKFVLTMKITNLDKKNTLTINDIKLDRDDGLKKIRGDFVGLKLAPLEEKELIIEFKTDIDFPQAIEISRTSLKDGSIKTYTLELK